LQQVSPMSSIYRRWLFWQITARWLRLQL
jgi:hypothetical protein